MKNLKAMYPAGKVLIMLSLAVLSGLAGLTLSCGKSPDKQQVEQAAPPEVKPAVKSVEKPVPVAPEVGGNFDKFIPDNVYVYVAVNNIAKLSDVCMKSSFGKLWNDPEVKKFTEKAIELLQKEFTKNVTKETDIAFNDIVSLAEVFCGQAAFVLDRIEFKNVKKQTKKPVLDENGQVIYDEKTRSLKYENVEVEGIEPVPHLILMAEVTKNKEKLESLLEKITKSVAQEGALKKAEDYKGISYFTFYRKQESTNLSYGYIDNIFFFSFGEKSLKRIIDAYKQPADVKALCTKPAYQKITANADAGRLATFYVNIPPFISMIKSFIVNEKLSAESRTTEELDGFNKTFDKVIDSCGLSDLKSIAGLYRVEGNNFIFEGLVDMPGAKKGIMAALTGDPTSEFKTIKAVPADTLMYMAETLSLTKLYDGIMDIMANVMAPEEYENGVKAQVSMIEEQLGLKIKDDILSVFGNEIAMIMNSNKTAFPRAMGMGFSPFNMAFAIPIVKPEAVKHVHEQIIKVISEDNQGKSPFVEKQYGGFTFYVMELPNRQMPGQPPLPEEAREIMGYFFTKDIFVYAIPAASLKSIADTLSGKNSGSLSADQDFTKLAARNKVTEKSIMISYTNIEKYLENMLSMFNDLVKTGILSELQHTMEESDENDANDGSKSPRPKIEKDEFAKLMKEMPQLDTLKKYFIGCKTIQQVYPTPDGIMWRSFTQMGPD